jgi:hypothetical protein
MVTAVSGRAMNGFRVETPKEIQRYALNVKVLGGTHHQNLKGLRND